MKRLGRGLHEFERFAADLPAAMTHIRGLAGARVEHLYLGLPVARPDLECILDLLPHLMSVDLALADDEALKGLALAQGLEAVRLRRYRETLGFVDGLPPLPALTSLELANWGPLAAGFLRHGPPLRRLALSRSSLAPADLVALRRLPHLTDLTLEAVELDGAALGAVASCEGLQALSLCDHGLEPLDLTPTRVRRISSPPWGLKIWHRRAIFTFLRRYSSDGGLIEAWVGRPSTVRAGSRPSASGDRVLES